MHRFIIRKGEKILHIKVRLCTKARRSYFQIWSREDRFFSKWRYIAQAEDEAAIRPLINRCFGYTAVITEME
ncbi:hypothetical protein [Rurimicrobium arvi]|uniref:hypothetical protein n=1 Tax=Rurimicrobium arvi TaxID=2049916 RepID=UPI0031D15245